MGSESKDNFGDRMKMYEGRYANDRFMPLLPVVARMDGRGFSKFCKGLRRPFDPRMSRLMIETTRALLLETNAKVGYTQSDEITLVWYSGEFEKQIWFDARVQKMVSHLASLTTGTFNLFLPDLLHEKAAQREGKYGKHRPDCEIQEVTPGYDKDELPRCTCGVWDAMHKVRVPEFDARVFDVPNLEEACNEVLWREVDATKNSVSMAAQHYYSHKQLHGKGRADQMDMLHAKGVNWNDYPRYFKRGTYLRRKTIERNMTPEEIDKIPADQIERHLRDGIPKIVRTKVVELELEPLMTVSDRVNVLLGDSN